MRHEAVPNGSFLLRTPLFPLDEALAWSEGLHAAEAPGDEATLARDRARLRERLRSFYARAEVQEALYLASPKLARRARAFLDGADDVKVERPLIRYFLRMCARPTPFGTFAGNGVGRLGATTDLRVAPPARNGRRTRLDHLYLTALAHGLEQRFTRKLTYRVNSSLYRAGGKIRYAEASTRGGRSYSLVAVEPNEAVVAVLERARDAATFDELARVLVDDDVTYDEAADFVEELIASQLLESTLTPPITGPEAIAALIDELAAVEGADEERGVLHDVRAELEKLDAEGLGVPVERYERIFSMVERLPAEAAESSFFQTDMVTALDAATIGPRVVDEIRRATAAVQRFAGKSSTGSLERWRAEFLARYETREVPLVEALDEESGIGFLPSTSPGSDASPLVRGLVWPQEPDDSGNTGPRFAHLMRRLLDCTARGDRELVLDDGDMDVLAAREHGETPDAFSVLVTIAARSAEAVDRGDFRLLLHGASGPSGARLMGRFCHADPAVDEAVREHLRAEEALRPEIVFAEIVHLPEGRSGNILARPVLRGHEIPFLGRSGAPPARQIPVTDLTVSVEGQKVVLRSRTLGREVAPRLASAQNYTLRSLGIYRFLCTVQAQGVAEGVVWNWGSFNAARFLPRVVYGKTVLHRARWAFRADEIPDLLAARGDEVFGRMQELRAARGLPRHVALADEDNQLLVDLDNVLSVEMLVELVRRRPHFRLAEMWPDPAEMVVSGEGGTYVNEVLVPFVRTESGIPVASPARPPGGRRSFAPGSEWLYLKVYTGTAVADSLLAGVVRPLVARARSDGAADRWFFIRYADPDPHLRIRLHGDPARLTAEVLPAFRAALEPELEGRVWRLETGTYVRELERYGGPDAIDAAEWIFAADSDAVLEVVAGGGTLDDRWRAALAGLHRMFADLGLDEDAQAGVARRMRDSYAAEFAADALLKRQIGDRYRAERRSLEPLVSADPGAEGALGRALGALARRSDAVREPVARLRALESAGRLTTTFDDLATSLGHMHVNRLIRSSQRAHEMVIYDLLDRLYTARAARRRPRP
ncbi:MAG TPA: lantibiotic dehydratase [Actinomycetota bacterium]|nr:lantibiotic dehydratase [Actinomycetota bacterium]